MVRIVKSSSLLSIDPGSAQAPCRLHVALHGCLQYPARRYYHDGMIDKITKGP